MSILIIREARNLLLKIALVFKDSYWVQRLLARLISINVKLAEYLHFLEMTLLVKDIDWALRLRGHSISARDVQITKTGHLHLKPLNISVAQQESHLQTLLFEGYGYAKTLVNSLGARFYRDEQGELFVEVAGLNVSIQRTEELYILQELYIKGDYNLLFSGPTVVWGIGMNVGLASIYFASQPDVVVVGFEPFKKTYCQALRNLALNPTLSARVRTFNCGISDSRRRETVEYHPEFAGQLGLFGIRPDYKEGLNFESEEIELEDVVETLDSIVIDYPNLNLIAKIDCEGSEYEIIDRLYKSNKLKLIDAMMVE